MPKLIWEKKLKEAVKRHFPYTVNLVAEKPTSSDGSNDIKDAVIRLAGNSQDGIQTVGGFLARLAGRSAHAIKSFEALEYRDLA